MREDPFETQGLDERRRLSTRALLADLAVLEQMLSEPDLFESGVRRIGAEVELVLVDEHLAPSPAGPAILDELPSASYSSELGRFNLELNLAPQVFAGSCLSQMETELRSLLDGARAAAARHGARVVLAGILPTLERAHLHREWMTPKPRYGELDRALASTCGGRFETRIDGLDELELLTDNVMLEAFNTSFQVHFQVAPSEFAKLYNLAQVVTAPVLATAVNSPLLLGKRLWHETRVALFEQSVDTRTKVQQARGQRSRVSFGDRFVERSMLELLRDDVARFRTLIDCGDVEDPAAVRRAGGVPRLQAWSLFNGTVYRWNRPCYGITNTAAGPVPHLRIENRVLPAGPTVADQMANAAFYFGLMSGVSDEFVDVTRHITFEAARSNFISAARHGLQARIEWLDGKVHTARDLVAELLPIARRGLLDRGLASDDVDRNFEILERRIAIGRSGASWALESLDAMQGQGSSEARQRALAGAMLEQQELDRPLSDWPLATPPAAPDWRDGFRTVEQIMTRDVFTVHPEDLIDLAASLMQWEHVRHVPVEDDQGRLVGIVGHRALLRTVGGGGEGRARSVAVREVMRPEPVTIAPGATTLAAISLMREHKLACLPVVEDGRLVGILTEHDFMDVARELLEKELLR